MIKIIYVADPEGGKLTMRAEGHAGYAPAGQDIVCAAVSVLVQTLANKVDAAARSGRLLTSCVQHGETFVVQALPKPGPNNLMVASWFDFVEEGLEYDTPLLACCAAEALYPHWLAAQMDLALGETARAANELQLYTSYVQEFAVWVRRNYMPAGGGRLMT